MTTQMDLDRNSVRDTLAREYFRHKAIILAGGLGTRLGHLSKITNKHLLPVGEYPMIYHPIFKVVESGIKDILIITGPEKTGDFISLLGSGNKFGCNFTYKVQDEPLGIAHALSLAEDFCGECLVILGDNIFQDKISLGKSPCVALKKVKDPSRFGVAEFRDGKLVSIIEKPESPPSDYAVTGIYHYPKDVFSVIKGLKQSCRGEYEITDVNNYYIKQGRMNWIELKGYWTDAGTIESLNLANQLVRENA